MKLYHTALVLAGWYLMLPPMGGGQIGVDDQAPLSKWTVSSGFDTAAGCNAAQAKLIVDTMKLGKPPTLNAMRIQKAIADSQCIATNDPRLKDPRKVK
jgi:hypothetical protein